MQAQTTRKCKLLAAFLTSYGKADSGVPQQAALFLKERNVVDCDDFADPGLSERGIDAASVACRIGGDLHEKAVLAIVLTHRAHTKRLLGKNEEALKDLDRALVLDPKNADILWNRAETKRELGRFKDALRDQDRAHDLDPNNATILSTRAETKRMSGKFEEALEDLNRAVELDSNDPFAFQIRGAVKWKLGQLEGALQDLDHAMSLLGHEDGDALAFRAAAKLDSGDTSGALEDAERGLHLLQRTDRRLPDTLELCQRVIREAGGRGPAEVGGAKPDGDAS